MNEINRICLFNLQGITLGIDATQVIEFLKKPLVTKIFDAPREVEGVFNLRGNLVTLLNLDTVVKGKKKKGDFIIIVQESNELIGLLVENIREIIEIDPNDFHVLDKEFPQLNSDFFPIAFKSKEKLIPILMR